MQSKYSDLEFNSTLTRYVNGSLQVTITIFDRINTQQLTLYFILVGVTSDENEVVTRIKYSYEILKLNVSTADEEIVSETSLNMRTKF